MTRWRPDVILARTLTEDTTHMGFIPDQLDWTYLQPPRRRVVESACHFCAGRPTELYQLPTFGLARADEPVSLACADCYEQVTFTAPRLAARVIFDIDAA